VGAVAWAERLRPLGVPLPEVLAHDVGPDAPLPHLVLERLPGDDLGIVHAALTAQERQALAQAVVAVQEAVHGLGRSTAYGYSLEPSGSPPRTCWADVVGDNLRRSAGRLRGAAPHVRRLHARVVARAAELRPVLDGVPAVPFLDDLTTKNVLVADGRLSGVVDVDVVCFGDPLYTPALTKVSLVAAGQPTDDVDAWLDDLAPDAAAFDLYCAVFCLDLLGEAGVTFDREVPTPDDQQRAERLVALASRLS
jgi:hypothetical protein